jgi:hypothetical protein
MKNTKTKTTKKMSKQNSEWQDIPSNWVSWGKEGDNIEGTLIGISERESTLPGKEGEIQKVYEIKADRGSFHVLENKKVVEEPTIVEAGELYNVGGRMGLDVQMKRIKLGQKVRIIFVEEKAPKTKGFNPLKIIKAQTNGVMDEQWQAGLDDKEEL